MDRSVDDVETRDLGRSLETVCVEELWLGLASVASFSIPPFGTVTVQLMTGCTRDSDVGSRDGEKWTRPLLILPCRRSFKDDLAKISIELAATSVAAYRCAFCQTGQIKSCSRWDGNSIENDGGTGRLGLAGGGSSCKCAGGPLVESSCVCEIRCRGWHRNGGNENGGRAESQPKSLK